MFFRSIRVAVETNADADWITPDKNRPHLSPASTAVILVLTTDHSINSLLWQTILMMDTNKVALIQERLHIKVHLKEHKTKHKQAQMM